MNSIPQVPAPRNEPVLSYAPGASERETLKTALKQMSGEQIEIPVIVGGREIRTGNTESSVMPHDHGHVLATWHRAGEAEVRQAVEAAREAQREWANWPWEDRIAVFLRAADLLATRYRPIMNAATMLGQSKTAHQAEIDAACEMIDFFRFNAHYAQKLYSEQPESGPGMWNRLDHRPLEGFVYAITPFNFTSIAGNLPTAPALLGNVAIWKPAASAMYSAYYIMKLLEEAGLPSGVINFVPGDPVMISDTLLRHRDLAGVHFTGSTAVFQSIWRAVGDNIASYRSYPRLVGETGGKDFIVAHASADVEALAVGIVRGGYEYQGQKCSAASRIYVPQSLWPRLRERVLEMIGEIKVGDPADFRNFMGAVIDRKAYDKITGYIKHAEQSDNVEIIAGGKYDDSKGYFIDPTLVEVKDSAYRLMCEEVFGPVVSLYAYPDREWEETLRIVDRTTPYALTGAVFAADRKALVEADRALRNAAGNYYVNDKPTGAVVGQQPFGGGRASGTNDKAGSILNLLRWISPRTIKETLAPPHDWTYPFMGEK
ncbi:MAG TPA: L-glutamate gamma-semialdehyde dehydrogenase [Longimicrobiaceae bacterium]|nr:L-glutamate gamma-semialdehyde dehydrogenase [Longimicrobiaceae bacterium]